MKKHEVQRRIVSILGLGNRDAKHPNYPYTPTCYKFDPIGASSTTPLIQVALHEIFKPQTKIQLYGTSEVEKQWLNKDGKKNPISLHGTEFLKQDQFNFIRIDDGKSPEELDELFWTIVNGLNEEPLSSLGESVSPDEIILDVTHGFRIQPIIALAAASYVQSRWLRSSDESTPILRVIYGAFGAKKDNVAPIWDITSFLRFSQWTEAFSAFERFGRADDLKSLANNLTEAEKDELRRNVDQPSKSQFQAIEWLRLIGDQASSFADALVTNRTEELPKIVSELQKTLTNDHSEKWRADEKFIDQLAVALQRDTEGLETADIYTVDGLKAIAKRVQLLVRYQQYSQAIILMDEALKVYCGLLICSPDADARKIYQTGSAFVRTKRREPTGSVIDAAWALADKIEKPRNTLAHAGFSLRNQGQARSKKLIETAKEFSEKFASLVQNMPAPGSERRESVEATDAVFLNFSNHPVCTWPKNQFESARERFGTPRDPETRNFNIRPSASIGEVVTLAERYARQAEELGAKHVFVAGELTFSTALVACLQKREITCYAATFMNESEEVKPVNGSVAAHSKFRFAGWREYPDLQRIFDEGD